MTNVRSLVCPTLIAGMLLSFSSTAAHAVGDLKATTPEEACEALFRQTGSLFVPAKLAGREGFAIVSTTSNLVVVNSPQEKLTFDGAKTVTHLHGKRIFDDDRPVYENLPVSCLGLPESRVLGVCFDLPLPADTLGPPIIGVVGTPFLRLHAFHLNLSVPTVRVIKSPVENCQGNQLPILWNKDIPSVPVELPVLGTRNLVLEFSADGLQLGADRIASLKRMGHIVPQNLPVPYSHLNIKTGEKTDRTQPAYFLRWLDIGGVRFVNVPCSETNGGFDDSIGLSLLQYLDLTIDFPQSTLWVSSANGAQPIQVPVCGCGIYGETTDAGELRITYLTPGSSAEAADLKTEDVIFEIDGKRFGDMSQMQIAETFFKAGVNLTLGIRRSGNTIHLPLLVNHSSAFPPKWAPEAEEFNPE